ncbi:MAG TPA: hypothetical protein GX531_07340 [Methanothermobacter sp.]|nr:hypothetical protein [Methanothermobacter sp.]
MKKEIGSNFWIDKKKFENCIVDNKKLLNDLKLTDENFFFFSTCRQAIRFCLQDINSTNKRALIPEYTCYSVIEPFIKEDFKIFHYPVDKKLDVKTSFLNDLIEQYNIDVLLIHPYFGFNTINEDKAIQENVTIIYDQTQSMYSNFDFKFFDYKVASLRKWAGLLDGAMASKRNKFHIKYSFEIDKKLENVMLEACDLKYKYMEHDIGEKINFLQKFQKGLSLIRSNNNLHRMSEKSLIIQSNLNISELIKKRRDNYKILLDFDWESIGEVIFKVLNDSNVPLYFPIYVKNDRKLFQNYLASNNIFAPVIWSKPEYFENKKIEQTTQWIYDHILCIPIDQRYGTEDMSRIKNVVEKFGESHE